MQIDHIHAGNFFVEYCLQAINYKQGDGAKFIGYVQ
jgi:hypothetical protein